MSTIPQTAAREAREAELDERREALETAGVDVAGLSDEQIDERYAELEQETAPPPPTTTAKAPTEKQLEHRLEEIMTTFESDLLELFGGDGPLVPVDDEGALGYYLPGALELKGNAAFRRCTTCNGRGQVLTGSVRAGQELHDCPDERCKGRGFWTKAPQPALTQPASEHVEQAATDEWDKPSWLGDTTIAPAV